MAFRIADNSRFPVVLRERLRRLALRLGTTTEHVTAAAVALSLAKLEALTAEDFEAVFGLNGNERRLQIRAMKKQKKRLDRYASETRAARPREK